MQQVSLCKDECLSFLRENRKPQIAFIKKRINPFIRIYPLFNISYNCFDYFTIAISSSGVTNDCSPVAIFFSVTLPSFISFSPTMATNGIFLALA